MAGRPRTIRPDAPATGAERQRARREALKRAGGRELLVPLTAEEAAALALIRAKGGFEGAGYSTDRDAIGAALLACAEGLG